MPFSELAFHHRLARPGTIIDVGANIGAFACHFSVWAANRLVAFEPFPPTFARLKAAIANGHGGIVPPTTTLHMAAVGEEPGIAKLSVPVVSAGVVHEWASVAKTFAGLDNVEVQTVEVPLMTIDGLCLDDVTAIKVDAEGYEPEVFRGARHTIERCRPIISCELEERHREGVTWYVPGFLAGLGYEGWFYHSDEFWPISSLDRATMQVATNSPAGSSYSKPYVHEFVFVHRNNAELRQRMAQLGPFRNNGK